MSAGASGSRLDGAGPVDLLWKQRFLKQHEQLLKRMNGLEEKGTVYEGRTKKAEQAAAACNAATKEINELKARLKAFEEDDQQQRQNEMVSNILSAQTRDTLDLKDKVTRLDGLDSRYRNQEADLGHVRQTLQQLASTVERLAADVKDLHDTTSADAVANASAVEDLAARLEHYETRDETRERQLNDVRNKLDAMETNDTHKTMRSNRLGEPAAENDNFRTGGTPIRPESHAQWRSGPEKSSSTLPGYPYAPNAASPSLPLFGNFAETLDPGTPTQRISRSIIPSSPDILQNAQIQHLIARSSTQATTLVEDSGNEDTSITFQGNEPQSRYTYRDAFSPRKKPRLDDKPAQPQARKAARKTPGPPKNVVHSPSKMVVLPVAYTPSPSNAVAPTRAGPLAIPVKISQPTYAGKRLLTTAKKPLPQTSAKRPPKGKATKTPAPTQADAAPSDVEMKEDIAATQSQTVQTLRRSARNLGPSAATDTQHVELGCDSRPHPVPPTRQARTESEAEGKKINPTPIRSKATSSISRKAPVASRVAVGPPKKAQDRRKAAASPQKQPQSRPTAAASPLKAAPSSSKAGATLSRAGAKSPKKPTPVTYGSTRQPKVSNDVGQLLPQKGKRTRPSWHDDLDWV